MTSTAAMPWPCWPGAHAQPRPGHLSRQRQPWSAPAPGGRVAGAGLGGAAAPVFEAMGARRPGGIDVGVSRRQDHVPGPVLGAPPASSGMTRTLPARHPSPRHRAPDGWSWPRPARSTTSSPGAPGEPTVAANGRAACRPSTTTAAVTDEASRRPQPAAVLAPTQTSLAGGRGRRSRHAGVGPRTPLGPVQPPSPGRRGRLRAPPPTPGAWLDCSTRWGTAWQGARARGPMEARRPRELLRPIWVPGDPVYLNAPDRIGGRWMRDRLASHWRWPWSPPPCGQAARPDSQTRDRVDDVGMLVNAQEPRRRTASVASLPVTEATARRSQPGGLDDHPCVRAAVRLAAGVLAPQAEQVDVDGVPASHVEALAGAGLLGLYGPADAGGSDVPAPVARRVTEVLSGADGATWFVWDPARHAGAGADPLGQRRTAPAVVAPAVPPCPGRDRRGSPAPFGGAHGAGLRRGRRRLASRRDGVVGDELGPGRGAPRGGGDRRRPGGVGPGGGPRAARSGRAAAPGPGRHGSDVDRTTGARRPGGAGGRRRRRRALDRWRRADADKTGQRHPGGVRAHRLGGGQAGGGGRSAGEPAALALARALAEETGAVRAAAYRLLDEVPAREAIEERLALRGHALELGVRAATALVVTSGGAGMSRSSPAQRLAREALFHLVQAQTPPVRRATLARLAEVGGRRWAPGQPRSQ